ncbi:MAG: S-layer homology domain-containing protein, partial [Ruminococcaceae bacterium]|nr:S-layer homology domain-containing protein [Oscillospiraceae bacterium]
FAPEAMVSRGMLVTVLYRLSGSTYTGETAFRDVSYDAWYAPAVAWAATGGIVLGDSETTFHPESPVTREQLATVLYRYVSAKKGIDTGETSLSAFRDAGEISDWAREAVSWSYAAGLIQGMENNTLAPGGTVTRAQMATVLMRLCETVLQ